MHVLRYPCPSGLVECCIEAVGSRGGVAAHLLDDGMEFMDVRGGIGEVVVDLFRAVVTWLRNISDHIGGG